MVKPLATLSILLAVILLAAFLPALNLHFASAAGDSLSAELPQIEPAKILNKQVIERGKDYQTVSNGDGTLTTTLGLPSYVKDDSTGLYVPHTVRIVNSTNVEVRSGLIGFKINKASATIIDPDTDEARAEETWLPFGDSELLANSYVSRSIIDNSTGIYVTNHYAVSYNGEKITIDLIYALPDGAGAQRIIRINGLSDPSIGAAYIQRQWTGLDIDAANIDGVSSDIEENTIRTVARSEAVQHSTGSMLASDGDVVETSVNPLESFATFSKGDKLQLLENLAPSSEKIQSISYGKDGVIFQYGGWTSGEAVHLIDDTFSSSSAAQDGGITTNAASGANCPSTSYSKSTTAATDSPRTGASGISDTCKRLFFEWSLSSLPTTASVSSVAFKFEIASITGTAANCTYTAMSTLPSSTSNATLLWNVIGSGSSYLSNDNTCASVGTNKSITLGGSANTNVQSNAGGSFAIGVKIHNETRIATTKNTFFRMNDAGSGTPLPTLQITYTAATVTIPIKLNAGTGTTAPFPANFTISGNGCTGTLGHSGIPASLNVSCYGGASITVTAPAATSTTKVLFSDGTTSKSFTSCSSGVCAEQPFTVYVQYKITITLSGLDASQSLSVSKKALGSSGSQTATGSATTSIWADEGTTFTVPATLSLSSTERFKSYNSTSILSFTTSQALTETLLYNHEFFMTPRVHEEHLGDIFQPMPLTSYTGMLTSSNNTETSITFNTQVTDDYLQPTSNYWFRNGTTSWTDITWVRGVVGNATGSHSITASGNFDVESACKHYGYTGQRHFRACVNDGTIDSNSVVYNANAATFAFNATATGTQTAKIEFLNLYAAVSDVKIDGVSYPSGSWAITDNGDGLSSTLTINNIPMTTNAIFIQFVAGSTSGPGGGGGGGGGGGATTLPPTGAPVILTVSVPQFSVQPGQSQTQQITISWTGATKIIVNSIEFDSNQGYFKVDKTMPFAAILDDSGSSTTQVPLTVSLPSSEQGVQKTVQMRVTAIAGASTAQQVVPVMINLQPTNDLAIIAGIGIIVVAVGGIAARRLRRR